MHRLCAFLMAQVITLAGCAVTGEIGMQPPVVVSPPPQSVQRLDIAKGHYPPPGSCRIWVPGVPPGQQSPPGSCADLYQRVPPGAVLVRG